jgi:hypothetical protein
LESPKLRTEFARLRIEGFQVRVVSMPARFWMLEIVRVTVKVLPTWGWLLDACALTIAVGVGVGVAVGVAVGVGVGVGVAVGVAVGVGVGVAVGVAVGDGVGVGVAVPKYITEIVPLPSFVT